MAPWAWWMVLGLGSAGAADPGASPPLVLEAYAGPRPAAAQRWIPRVRTELQKATRSLSVEALNARIAENHSGPANPLSTSDMARAKRLTDRGCHQFRFANFAKAAEVLDSGTRLLRSRPTTMIDHPATRKAYRTALVCLALAKERLNDGESAQAAWAEAIRTFARPKKDLERFGPDALRALDAAETQLAREGRGSLEVAVEPAEVTVFLNERMVGPGSRTLSDLPPGEYRVLVAKDERRGRVHRVRVDSNQTTKLEVDWSLDRALRTEPDWVGFAFTDEEEREANETKLAGALARALGASRSIVLGVRTFDGGAHAIGRGSDDSAQYVVPLKKKTGPSRGALRRFARALTRSNGGSTPAASTGPAPALATDTAAVARVETDPTAIWKWTVLGGGVAATAAGIALIAVNQTGATCLLDNGQPDPMAAGVPCECEGTAPNVRCSALPSTRDTAVPGAILAGAGAVAVGIGAFLVLSPLFDDDDAGGEAVAATWTPVGDGFVVGARGRF